MRQDRPTRIALQADPGDPPAVRARDRPNRGPAVIGLDVGTSAVKGLLVDRRGAVATVRRGYRLDTGPGGRVELDAEHVWRATRGAIRTLAAAAQDHGLEVVAVCCGGSGDEAVWVDDRSRPVAPVPMALDRRSASDGAAFVDAIGGATFTRTTGLPPSGAYPLPRLLWLRRTQPDAAARVRRLLAWPEFIAVRLGVDAIAEPTLAARTGAWNIGAGRWDDAILARSGVERSLLPRPGLTGDVAGVVASRTAATLGLPRGVVVVAGGFDQAMATRGAGITGRGVAHLGAGSWEALTALTREQPIELVERGFSVGPVVDARRVWSVMTSAPGGAALEWLDRAGRLDGARAGEGSAAQVASGASVRRVLAAASRAPDEPTGLVVLPDLDGSDSSGAGGTIAGLRIDVDPAILARGLVEGIALSSADAVEALAGAGVAIEEIRLTGGATDRRWTQLRADVLGVPVVTVEPHDAGVATAAALAWSAVVRDQSVGDVLDRLVRLGPSIEPRADHHARYNELRRRRADLRAAIAGSTAHALGIGR